MRKLPLYLLAILITWQAPPIKPDQSDAPATYRIYRRTVNNSYELLREIPAAIGAQSVEAVDDTTVTGLKYCYQVSAANTAGESAPTNEACGISIVGDMIGVDIPANRTGLISRRATDGSTLVSFLVNSSDIVAVNDSVLAPSATVTIVTPPGKTVLISKRATDGSTIVPMLVNKSESVFINGQQK